MLELHLDADALASSLAVEAADLSSALLTLHLPLALRRRGVELKIVAGSAEPAPDARLVSALARAHRWARQMRESTPLAAIAAHEGASEPFVSSRVRLAFLAPALQLAILAGTQPSHLTLERIVRAGVPLGRSEQMRLCGVDCHARRG